MKLFLRVVLVLFLTICISTGAMAEYGTQDRSSYFGATKTFEVARFSQNGDYYIVVPTEGILGIKIYRVYCFDDQLEDCHELFHSTNVICDLIPTSDGLYYYRCDDWKYGDDVYYWKASDETRKHVQSLVNELLGYCDNKLLYWFNGELKELDTLTGVVTTRSTPFKYNKVSGKYIYYIESSALDTVVKFDISTMQSETSENILAKAMLLRREVSVSPLDFIFYNDYILNRKSGALYEDENRLTDASFVIDADAVAISEQYICASFTDEESITLKYASIKNPEIVHSTVIPKPEKSGFAFVEDEVFFYTDQNKEMARLDLATNEYQTFKLK